MSRKLEVEIIGDARSLERAFGRAGASTSRFGATFGRLGSGLATVAKVGAVVGVAMGAAVAGGAWKATQAATNLNEQINKAGVVFAKNGKQVIDWASGLAQSFGLSQRAALEAAGTFGNMLVPMGFARGKAADLSKGMVELAGDLASFNNASPEETLEALRSGLAGETEPLRRFGVFLSEGRLQQEALRMGLIKTTKEGLDPQQKALATYSLIMKDTKDAHGDFGRTSEGLANQQRILRAELENSAAKIGQALLPAATAVLGVVADLIPKVTEWGQALAERLGPAIERTVGFIQTNWPQVRAIMVPVLEAVGAAIAFLAGVAERVWPRVQAAAQRVAQWYQSSLKPAIDNVISAIRAIWERFGEDITRILTTAFNAAQALVRNALNIIKGVINLVLALIRGDWSEAWNSLKSIVSNALSAAVTLVRTAVSLFLTAAKAIGKAIIDGIVAGLAALATKLLGLLRTGIEMIRVAAEWAYNAAINIGKQIIQGVWDGLQGLAGAIKDAVGSGIKAGLGAVNPFSPVSHGGEIYIGRPLAEGAIYGWLVGIAPLSEKISQKLREALERGRQAIQASRGVFESAFGELSSVALQAFDRVTAGMKTKSEQLLEQMDLDRRVQEIKDRLAAAQAALGEAQAGGDPERIKAAEKALADALYEQTRFSLEQRAAAERAKLDEDRALKRRHFEERLTALQIELAREGATHQEAHKKLMKLFEKFKVDYAHSGKILGAAIVEGLRDSLRDVEAAAAEIAEVIRRHLKLKSPAEEGPLADLDTWWRNFVPTLTGGLDLPGITAGVDYAVGAGYGRARGGGVGGESGDVVIMVDGTELARLSRKHLLRQKSGTVASTVIPSSGHLGLA